MKEILVVYWSGTGNTEKMANAICDGIAKTGDKFVLKSVDDASADDVKSYSHIALGCSSMGAEVLEEAEMEPFVESITGLVSGKKLLLFGSYGWGDGQWMRDWYERMDATGAQLISEGLIVNETPDADGIALCEEAGQALAKA